MGQNRRILRVIYISLFLSGILMLLMDIFRPKSSDINSSIDEDVSFDFNKNFGDHIFEDSIKNSEIFKNSKKIEVSTKVYDVVFSTYRGNLISLKLKNHLNLEKKPIEMLDLKSEYENFLRFSFDSFLKDVFKYRKIDDFTHEFLAKVDYKDTECEYIKRYKFSNDNEYLIRLDIFLKDINGSLLDKIGKNYELIMSFRVEKLSKKGELQYNNHMNQVIYYDNKLRYAKDRTFVLNPNWVGISSKYFEVLLKKDKMNIDFKKNGKDFKIHILNELDSGVKEIKDSFYIYAGPKDYQYLNIYNYLNLNSFGVSNFNLDLSINKSMWYFIQILMQLVMQIFYNIIPNWGLSIIFLTVVVRILIFPLTFKGFRATAELSKLQPKIKNIQVKHKNNSKKINEEMIKLYKEEGINPLGGFLPIILQLPVFFALYGLVNNFFLLRGADFVPGWIDDLSIGDSVYHFGYKIFILGWTDIRLLPLIMMFTQLISTMISSNIDFKSFGVHQKFLYFGIPIVFFFILYNMPSGILIYWITTNIFTILQQYYIKKHLF